MRAHPKLTEAQITKAVKMSEDGATHKEIAANMQLPVHQIGDAVNAWTKAHAERLKTNLRSFINANIAIGKLSMILPKTSPTISRPVLAEFAKLYTITTKIKLSCMWHQFTPKANPCK